ncbi:hypothetical protein [Roseobacter sp. CCS2]|uniref:hypothetical protein n=1 Tax=Roseobacter sp. CCS2 TaxID=391593 RepID=UPI0000F40518|nr:hypothetical protein [Roseobacter sp. CCS2]EBA13015.1 hypothetical protein RCCS2_03999 [Roseobacter sp. CCS2]
MSRVYEYRRAPNKGPVWLALMGAIMLLVSVVHYGATDLVWLAWAAIALTIAWMVLPRPVSGIRIDNTHLVLSAWRNPRPIPLDHIAHLQVRDMELEGDVTIVYRNGEQEDIFTNDLPDVDTLIAVLAERGIPVRDVT